MDYNKAKDDIEDNTKIGDNGTQNNAILSPKQQQFHCDIQKEKERLTDITTKRTKSNNTNDKNDRSVNIEDVSKIGDNGK